MNSNRMRHAYIIDKMEKKKVLQPQKKEKKNTERSYECERKMEEEMKKKTILMNSQCDRTK